MPAWLVRAGRNAEVIDRFRNESVVGLGWGPMGDVTPLATWEQIRDLYSEKYPEAKPGQVRGHAGMIYRFLHEMKTGDGIATYDSRERVYVIGRIVGDPYFDPEVADEIANLREDEWHGTVLRDRLSVGARNSLGAIQTLFSISDEVWAELVAVLDAGPGTATSELPRGETGEKATDLEALFEDTIGRAHEFIKDRVNALTWQELQDLVAGILRAMNYRTQVSPPGSDLGKDVFASPDGLGLESPRIRVEVKHRTTTAMGAPEIRSFLAGLRRDDRGLFVSTGGFTREARYEAERSERPITLIDLDRLVALLVTHYERMDIEARSLVPLRRVYWPEPS